MNTDEISATSREDMRCPNCYQEGLEPHSLREDEFEGKYKILKATRCSNPDCKYSNTTIPQEYIEAQYESSTTSEVREIFLSLSPLSESSSITDVIYVVGFAIFSIGLILNILGFNVTGFLSQPSQAPEGVDQQIAVQTSNGETVNATVLIGNRTVNTTGRTTLTIRGDKQITVSPEGNYATNPTVHVSVSENGRGISGGSINETTGVTLTNGTLVFEVRNKTQRQFDTVVGKSNITTQVNTVNNIKESLDIEISPVKQGENEKRAVFGESESTVISPGVVINGTQTVRGKITSNTRQISRTWSGSPQKFELTGNIPSESLSIQLSSESNINERSVTRQVSNGTSIQIESGDGGSFGDASVRIFGGTARGTQTNTGVWDGTDPVFTLSQETIPTEMTIQVTGNVTTNSVSTSGTVTENRQKIREEFKGNLKPRNPRIVFTGGEFSGETVGEASISIDSQTGSGSASQRIFVAPSSGEYQLTQQVREIRNEKLVSYGYAINGERTSKLNNSEKSTTLELTRGDTVSLWGEVQTKSADGGNAQIQKLQTLDIVRSRFSETNLPKSGGRIGSSVTVKNPTETRVRETVILYKDGIEWSSRDISLAPQQTQTVRFQLGVSSPGYHTLQINDKISEEVVVGKPEDFSGMINVSVDAVQTNGEGRVAVDTNQNGEYNCRVSVNSGVCDLQNVGSGLSTISIAQLTTQKANYEIKYTARSGPRGVSVDYKNDGSVDAQHRGILRGGESITTVHTASQTTVPVDIETQNGGEVSYEVSWRTPPVAAEPSIKVNGQLVFDSSRNYTEERVVSIGKLQPGKNTIEFGSKSGSYQVEIKWVEPQDASSLPTAYIDGQAVCEPEDYTKSGVCSVSSPGDYELGSHVVRLEGTEVRGTQYTLTQKARAVPTSITVTTNGEVVTHTKQTADTVYANGSWISRQPVQSLSIGRNTISLTPESERTEISLSATGHVEYRYGTKSPKNPSIIISNGTTSTSVQVPNSALSSNGVLKKSATVSFDKSSIPNGNISIKLKSSNNGVARLSGTYTDYPTQNPESE